MVLQSTEFDGRRHKIVRHLVHGTFGTTRKVAGNFLYCCITSLDVVVCLVS